MNTSHTTAHTFLASWAVLDLDLTLRDAVAEATALLPDLLFDCGAALLDRPTWRLTDAPTVGRPDSDGIVLAMSAPAMPWTDLLPKGITDYLQDL